MAAELYGGDLLRCKMMEESFLSYIFSIDLVSFSVTDESSVSLSVAMVLQFFNFRILLDCGQAGDGAGADGAEGGGWWLSLQRFPV